MNEQNTEQKNLLDLQWVRRALLLALFDAGIIAVSSILALMARFDLSYTAIDSTYLSHLYYYLPINIIVTLIILYVGRMYRGLW